MISNNTTKAPGDPLMDFSVYLGKREVSVRSKNMRVRSEHAEQDKESLSYFEFQSAIHKELAAMNVHVYQTSHATQNSNAMYFGIAEISGGTSSVLPLIAWRSSTNQRVAATLYLGIGLVEQNIVCLTNSVNLKSRQSTLRHERVPELVHHCLEHLGKLAVDQKLTVKMLKGFVLSEAQANETIIDMVRQGIINTSKTGAVIAEWDSPRLEGLHESHTMWRLFHAVAESYKPLSNRDAITALIDRSPQLMAYMKSMIMERL